MATFIDNHTGSAKELTIKLYGTRTTDPCLVVLVGNAEFVTTDIDQFFAMVDEAKEAWNKSRKKE